MLRRLLAGLAALVLFTGFALPTPGRDDKPGTEKKDDKGKAKVLLTWKFDFEKKTPFGTSTWVRKKSDLTDEEKVLTADPRAQSNANGSSVDSKPAGNQ